MSEPTKEDYFEDPKSAAARWAARCSSYVNDEQTYGTHRELAAERDALKTKNTELLEALKEMVACCHPNKIEHPSMFEAWQDAKSVIRRAEEKKGNS